ncbi:putative E3 ubiquitin-protein ligase RING1a [Citrus sinensis]|uniref:putative E3 ubiquitin-protein ligase RING1a isoform X2 n=1 Tax=Citrus sinensis TaxID=2711 RepID=UPI0003D77DA5|nr:putative E3 ubiquitin-protein ligase RING1a isoform X2 [Citrus sinensis]KAH9743921.1 putative E3 ubiquitin-protein ligase RING1a [Citrus sinensis]
MPAQKRSLQESHHANNGEQLQGEEQQRQDSFQQSHAKQSRHERQQLELQQNEQQQLEEDQKDDEEVEGEGDEEDEENEDDSEGPSSDTSGEKPEFVFVELPEIRKDVQCPICLGIIKKTRTVMECLHRFCRECIDKSMRLGNNECPACRTHCASRRSLRDDPNYDALISALYPDIDKYEEEELAFHEEERTRNKQIQASIAKIFQRQSEALVKRRTPGKDTVSPFMTRPQRNPRTAHLRRRRNSRGTEHQGSEDNEDENDDNGGKDSSSNDERSAEVRPRRRKRRSGIRSSQPSSSAANSDGGCIENDLEVGRESRGISPGLVWNPEMLAWGRGGTRSNTRHGSASGCNIKSSRSTRLNKLVEYLRSLQENNDELDVRLMLVSADTQCAPSLQQPYLCCQPSLSVKQLCETPLQAEEVEILMVKERLDAKGNQSTPIPTTDQLQILEGQETLAGLRVNHTSNTDHLILAYRQKQSR